MTSMPPPPEGNQPGQSAPQPHQGGYQAAPQFQPGGAPQVPTRAPKSIQFAKYAMWAGALVQLLALPLLFVTMGTMRETIEEELAAAGQAVDPSVVDAAVMAGLVFAGVMIVLGVILWLLIAFFTGRGKGWARIVGTVLFGLYVLSMLASIAQPTPAINLIMNVLTLIIGGVAVFFLWQKDSTAWFQAHKGPRY